MNFPTIDPDDPYRLSAEEQDIMERLEQAFLGCEKLQEHMRFLLSKGGLYKVHNGNLLYHGCVPLNADGSFRKVRIFDQVFQGKSLYDALERYVPVSYTHLDVYKRQAFAIAA